MQRGTHHTEETKKMISKRHKGKKLSKRTKRLMTLAKLGHIVSEETRAKMSESAKHRKKKK